MYTIKWIGGNPVCVNLNIRVDGVYSNNTRSSKDMYDKVDKD